MAGKRKNDIAEIKAKVALEAIRGEMTVAELVAKHGVHQMVINTWKRQAIEGTYKQSRSARRQQSAAQIAPQAPIARAV
ncbi:hypothetical protein BV392_06735 [Rhodovulum sulfidophilum]|nr:hypothetical protein BV392_06735 [Rhodovulum sulfidophilum]